jgi:hypothetical protein
LDARPVDQHEVRHLGGDVDRKRQPLFARLQFQWLQAGAQFGA